jgi:hypothetical protein
MAVQGQSLPIASDRSRLTKLVASLGANFPMTDLGEKLFDCPNKNITINN